MLKKCYLPMAALSVLGLTTVVTAAQTSSMKGSQRRDGRYDPKQCAPYQQRDEVRCKQTCPPQELPAPCYPDDCFTCPMCLGPENFAGNPPVCPRTCDGDWNATLAAFYWNAHQDGMEFVIVNDVVSPDVSNLFIPHLLTNPNILALNNLIGAKYENLHSKWEFGFKLGLGYCSPCDGWDIGVLWTRYHGRASEDIDGDSEDNITLLPIWSAFTPAQGSVLYATQATAQWKPKLNLIDIELGRQYWVSKYLSIRPFIGLRYASVDQDLTITYRGGSWGARTNNPIQQPFNGIILLENDFKGFGVRSGLNSEWNFGCGWALYGDLAASIVYGRFEVEHDETIRQAIDEHLTFPVLDSRETFRACRGILDLGLGIQWSRMFCHCKYGFTARFGWEGHTFFDQNQMWRVSRVGAASDAIQTPLAAVTTEASATTIETSTTTAETPTETPVAAAVDPVDQSRTTPNLPNNQGNNVFNQRRGSLDTQGWTLTLKFEF